MIPDSDNRSIPNLISDLVHPTIEIARVISSVAKGNLSQAMPQEIGGHALQGEFAQIAKEVNDMVKQLNLFSMEVTRVAREVGSEGKLGGQAKVKGVAGVWKDLTDSVNQMGSNLTAQVRKVLRRGHCRNRESPRPRWAAASSLSKSRPKAGPPPSGPPRTPGHYRWRSAVSYRPGRRA